MINFDALNEIREKKAELERKIKALISKFEEETDTEVYSVGIEKQTSDLGVNKIVLSTKINVEVKL